MRKQQRRSTTAIATLAFGAVLAAASWAIPATAIPALDARLTVVAQPQGQEVQASGGIFEGAASVTGWYRGKPVTGQAYVEQLGNWR